MRRLTLVWLAGAVMMTGCWRSRNYTQANAPRYAGEPPPHMIPTPAASDTIKVVSFNVEYALRPDSALKVLTTESALRDADIILLQEMDGPTARYMARQLGMWYVYYPSTLHFLYVRDLGNAVLSRWPIVADERVRLPHKAFIWRTERTATAATIKIDTTLVRVYSTHLGTIINVTGQQRRNQLEAVLSNAARYARVIVGGDTNDPKIGDVATRHGYLWPTNKGPRTATLWRLDHIFLKGLSIPDSAAAGVVLNSRNASDHRPIWALAIIEKK